MSHLQNQNSGGHLIQAGGTMAYGGRVGSPMRNRRPTQMARGGRTPMRGRTRPAMGRGGRASMNRHGRPTQMARGGRTPMRGRTRPSMGRGGRTPMQRGRNSMMVNSRRTIPAMRR